VKYDPCDILCLCTHHSMGGAQTMAARLTSAFRQRGYSSALGFLFEVEPDARHEIDDPFIIADRRPRSVGEWLKFVVSVRRYASELKPKVIFGFHPFSNIVGAAMGLNGARVIPCQAWPSDQQSRGTDWLETLLIKTPLYFANIAVSKAVADTYDHRGPIYQRKTRVIYNEPPVLPTTHENRTECREALGISTDGLVLGCIGRLHEQKNFQLAIRAMARVENAQLYIAGGGPEEAYLKELVVSTKVQDRVHFLGPLSGEDISRFYKAVEVVLMPSIYEGHPLVMLEAMAAGVPVIANNIPVMREAGADAALYADGKPEAWSDAIGTFKNIEREKLIAAGYKQIELLFEHPMVERYLEIAGLPSQHRRSNYSAAA
jgi:glycosyltransferase involved in cell wall biosynthesis